MNSVGIVNFLSLMPLTPDYLPRVLELDHLCFGGLWTTEGYQREIDSPNSDLLILAAFPQPTSQQPGKIIGIGCLWAILEEAHITLLGIDPPYRGRGLGQLLLYGLLAAAEKRGLERATLEVRASNRAAIALYRKFGFREAGRRRRYYPDNEDALIFWQSGLHHPEFGQTLENWQQQIRQRLQTHAWQWAQDEDAIAAQ